MILIAAIVLTALSFTVFGEATYTEIRTAEDLKTMSKDGNYRLAADITLSDGTSLSAFAGHLDGNGKKIQGLTAPLFDSISGKVSNLTLEGSIVLNKQTQLGALANKLEAYGVIDSVTVNVTISGKRPSAAILLGGIVGLVESGAEILNSTKLGDIAITGVYSAENENGIGGIAGKILTGATLKNCQNLGNITVGESGNTKEYKGALAGIVGLSNGATYIENCLNAGDVKAIATTLCTAGILGRTETTNSACPSIINCVNKGDIIKTETLNENCAGIASYLRGGNIEWNINFGKVTNTKSHASGIVGYYNGSGATLNLKYNVNVGTGMTYSIISVNGTNNLKPESNFYQEGTTACGTTIKGTVTFTDKADLVNQVTAIEGAKFITDFAGADAVNDGYPIAIWQCTHNCEIIKDIEVGEFCSHCKVVFRTPDCEHTTFGEWIVDQPATEYADGERHRVCTGCGGVQKEVIPATLVVNPIDGVYYAENAVQLDWIFRNIESGSVPATAVIKLTADIDVAGKLPMLTVEFQGTFDGNGKIISGLSNAMFQQFNGTVTNLTLRGAIDATGEENQDIARKTASFALNASGANLNCLVSYMNIKMKTGNINGGGLVGYMKGKNQLTNCQYHGELAIEWTGNDAGIGGIVGWVNPNANVITLEDCYFGGKITVTGGVADQSAWIGGILGNESQATIIMKNCISAGTIVSEITAGKDFVGGILGINRSENNEIEFCANKSRVTATVNAGGIMGGILDQCRIQSCANYGEVQGASVGEFCGVGEGVVLTCVSCVDFSQTNNKLCSTEVELIDSYASDVVTFDKTFTLGGVEYDRYSVCTINKANGIPVNTLTTDDLFAAYVSTRKDGEKQALRFVIVTNCAFVSDSVTVSIRFKDFSGAVIKTYTAKLGGKDSTLTLYTAVSAGGENYFAANGKALFGCVITNVPMGVWEAAELTISDTNNGTMYLGPVEVEGHTEPLTMESLPDLSVLGKVSEVYNCGPGLMSDRNDYTEEDSYMMVITASSKEKLEAYIATLPEHGFTFVSKTSVDGDDYYTYSKYGSLVYMYYNRRVREVRIITDNSSDLLSKICYDYEKKAGETTEFYQYSLNHTENNVEGYDPIEYSEKNGINCGMLYIIKLPDNSVILVDSGHEKQSTRASRAGIMNFLREITGTPEGEKINIAMWYFTHAHGDHVRLASDLITEYQDQINLKAVTYNFPSYQVLSSGYDSNTFTLKNTINRCFPDVIYHKLHTGEVLNLAGLTMEVVYTHEDAVTAAGTSEIGDFNSSSTVLKITMDGKVIMLLGDISGVAESAITSMHTRDFLKADAVQSAHHCLNYLNTLYPIIDAEIAIIPQSAHHAMVGNAGKYNSMMQYASEAYFAHKYTYKFVVENGKIVATALPRYDQR